MELLYNEIPTRTDTYCYEINSGGELYVQESGQVKIGFDNKEFVRASCPFSGTYSRNGWRILAAINEKIKQIEQALKEPTNAKP